MPLSLAFNRYLLFVQNTRPFYVVVMNSEELRQVQVDVWNPSNPAGYQRDEDQGRIREIKEYLLAGGISPSALLINVRGRLSEREGRLLAEGELYIYDGQHRKGGVINFSDETGRGFEVPVVLTNFDTVEEALQFLKENRTAKGVRADLAERIIEEGRIPRGYPLPRSLLRWIPVHQRAVKISDVLNTRADSPFNGEIQPPNVSASRGVYAIRQISVTGSLEQIVRNLGERRDYTDDELSNGLVNFWKAVQEQCSDAFTDTTQYVIKRTTGVFSMHEIFQQLAMEEPDPARWTVDFFKVRLRGAPTYMNAPFWLARAPVPNLRVAGDYGTSRKSFSQLAGDVYREIIASRRGRP